MKRSTRRRLDLAGQWDLAFDNEKVGHAAGWAAGAWPAVMSEVVQAPALWTVTHPDKTGIGYYRRTFEIPADWRGQVARLCLGGVSYRLDAWLNGVYIGSHEGAYTPFSFDVSQAMRAGSQNEVVLRVASLAKNEAVDGMLLQQCPASKQSWYYIEAGLWGDVYLEALPPLWCEAVAIDPDLLGRRVSRWACRRGIPALRAMRSMIFCIVFDVIGPCFPPMKKLSVVASVRTKVL